jgi:hypothetical protein
MIQDTHDHERLLDEGNQDLEQRNTAIALKTLTETDLKRT